MAIQPKTVTVSIDTSVGQRQPKATVAAYLDACVENESPIAAAYAVGAELALGYNSKGEALKKSGEWTDAGNALRDKQVALNPMTSVYRERGQAAAKSAAANREQVRKDLEELNRLREEKAQAPAFTPTVEDNALTRAIRPKK